MNCSSEYKTELNQTVNSQRDSVSIWLKYSKIKSLSLNKRKLYLNKIYNVIKSTKIDSSSTRILSKVAYQYYQIQDKESFKKLNKEVYKLALKIRDTFSLADIHWSEAEYYKKNLIADSAYYHYNKAKNYFIKTNHQLFAAKMLYGMSIIKGRYRDYSGSESLIIQAISKYKKLENYRGLYASYNHLAILQKDIKEFDKSIFYHNKALEYSDKIKDKDYKFATLNNLGNVYVEKEEYSQALLFFDDLLKKIDIKKSNIERYARVKDNRAYCKLLMGDTINLKFDFFEALKIRDSIDDKIGVSINKIHLSKYFLTINDTISSLKYATESNALSKRYNFFEDYLSSLSLLSNLDLKNSKKHLDKYISFSDSINNLDRKMRNKFTRISYETDEYIEETERLSKQKFIILIGSFTLLIFLSLIYYIRIQKDRNEKLLLETQQKKDNEQIYILTMNQQKSIEEERSKERIRISKELHDNVLSNLFAVRMNLGFLDIRGEELIIKKHDQLLNELQVIEKEIRDVSHRLNIEISSSDIDFNSLLKYLIEDKSKLGKFNFELNIDDNIKWKDLDKNIQVNLFRILQESLQNVIKYSKAQKVNIKYSIEDNNLIFEIRDNGLGFNVNSSNKGTGIKNMKSRTEQLKGEFSIQSEINKGTLIQISIPITKIS